MAIENPQLYNNSNWTFMYVVLSLIPVAFVAVSLISIRRDRMARRQSDIETADRGPVFERAWFPRREAIAASEGSEGLGGTIMTSSSTERKRTDSFTQFDTAKPKTNMHTGIKRKPLGNEGGYLSDLEEVPL